MIEIISYKSKTGSTLHRHVIFEEKPVATSYASLVLLQNSLMLKDIDYLQEAALKEKYHWLQRVLFSREFLHKVLEKEGDLCCTYCRKNKLVIEEAGEKVPMKIKATIDHVVPTSKGGEVYNTKNIVVACETCNKKKSNMSLQEFLKRFQKILNPNFEILKPFL